jgi:long-subunit acyl-CoA synthetase (AMP-forming)
LPEDLRLGCGGAPLPHVMREAFFKRHGFHIMTSYGLTEAPTVVANLLWVPARASARTGHEGYASATASTSILNP